MVWDDGEGRGGVTEKGRSSLVEFRMKLFNSEFEALGYERVLRNYSNKEYLINIYSTVQATLATL